MPLRNSFGVFPVVFLCVNLKGNHEQCGSAADKKKVNCVYRSYYDSHYFSYHWIDERTSEL